MFVSSVATEENGTLVGPPVDNADREVSVVKELTGLIFAKVVE